ncbi:MAG: POT family MFS transporter [Verrucomicrobiota bacterium]
MANNTYPTKALETDRMPPGIPYIIGNEAAERFSFYGMRTILVVFMTKCLVDRMGQPDHMSPEQAKAWFHTFVSAVYFLPFLGAIVADAFLGKYRTIFWLSLVYCLGHLALALDDTRLGLTAGLILISLGSGGIKPCVSANVGDQFGLRNQHLLPRIFSWFYFSINFGSFFSTMLTPWLLDKYGPRVAFGVPGIFMLLATIIFWLGRNTYVRVPPAGKQFVRELFRVDNLKLIAGLIPIYLAVAMFWSLWDQTGSAWVLQAEKMNLRFLGFTWLPSQVQAANPILILLLIPLSTYLVYPMISRVFPLTPLRKIALGFFLTVPSFLLTAWVEQQISLGHKPNIGWQILSYIIISQAEIMVSITCLEFSYSQAPRELKSLIMSLYLASVGLGNAFTALINVLIQKPDGTSLLSGPAYFLFFAGLMALTAVAFIFIAMKYREKKFLPVAA